MKKARLRHPAQYRSLDEMHNQGYYMESEISGAEIEQKWIMEMKRQDMSIPELAEKAGLHRQSLYAAAKGDCQLSLESAFRLSLVMGKPVDELFHINSVFSKCFFGGKPLRIDPQTLQLVPEAAAGNGQALYKRIDAE